MSALTDYKTFTVHYDEDADQWFSKHPAARAKSLKALKAKLDEIDKQERRVSVPALMLSSHYGAEPTLEAVTVTLLCPPERGANAPSEAWISHPKNGRSKERVANLFADTPETRDAFAAFMQARAEEAAAKNRTAAARNAIPRFTGGEILDHASAQ